MQIVKTIKTARRIRRLERSQGMTVAQQLEALTDNSFLERAVPKSRTEIALIEAGRVFQSFGTTVAEIAARPKTPREVYSKDRNIIQ